MSSTSDSDTPPGFGPGEEPGSLAPLIAQRAQRPREDGLGDPRQRHAELERVLRGPAAGALLLGLVDDHVDQRLAGLRVRLVEHGRGDLDQERLEVAPVPVVEDALDGRDVEPDAVAQEVVGLRDQLHVGVLDAVVDHLHVVAGAVGADVRAARLAVHLGGDRGEDLLDVGVGLARPARHDRGAIERALLTAGDARADEAQPLGLAIGLAAARVGEVRVAGVDDDVALVEQRLQRFDHAVDRRPGLDHDDDAARALEGGDELLQRLGTREVALGGELGQKLLRLGGRPIVDGNRHAAARDVAREVGPHDGEPGDPDLAHVAETLVDGTYKDALGC